MHKAVVVLLLLPGMAGAAADIDPFTGETLVIEQTRASVALTKAQNELLDEQTKKAHAEFMLKNADRIFAAELHKQLSQTNAVSPNGIVMNYPDAHFPEPAHQPAPLRKAKQWPDLSAGVPVVEPVVPTRRMGLQLLGTLEHGGQHVAILDNNGQSLRVQEGGMVLGYGKVSHIGDGCVTIGDQQYEAQPVTVSNADQQDISTLAKRAMNPMGASGTLPINALSSAGQMTGMPPARFGQ